MTKVGHHRRVLVADWTISVVQNLTLATMGLTLPSFLINIPRSPVTALGLPLLLGVLSGSPTGKVVKGPWYNVGIPQRTLDGQVFITFGSLSSFLLVDPLARCSPSFGLHFISPWVTHPI